MREIFFKCNKCKYVSKIGLVFDSRKAAKRKVKKGLIVCPGCGTNKVSIYKGECKDLRGEPVKEKR